MPDILHLQPQEVDTVEKRGKYSVCVIGCGQLGVQYAAAFVEAGFKVACADADQSLVRRLAKGRTAFSQRELESKLKGYVRAGALNVMSDVKSAVVQSDVIILAIILKIDEKKNSDFSEAENLCKQIGSVMQRGALVIYGGMTSFGFTEGVIKETLENASGFKAGGDFGLAYAHSQAIEHEQPAEIVGDQEWTVAANDKASLDAASLLLSTITKKPIRQVMNVKVAELTTLFAFARRDVAVALTNELAVLCEKAGVDYFDTLKLMSLRLQASDHTPTIAEGSEKTEAYLLLESAENFGVKLRLPELARQINEGMVRHAVNLTQDTLRSCGKTLRRSRIAVLGATGPRTSGECFVRLLESKGARINLYDPRAGKSEDVETARVLKRTLNEAVENADCIVILTAEDPFKRLSLKNLRSLMKTQAAIVDLAGLFESATVESEGFIYRGLGRGVEKK
jgi:nucleotide sugar dehydrogenase